MDSNGSTPRISQGTRAEYRGRFAPSPTGPLHAGSLVAAVGSYISARAAQGRWFVRIEDVDSPRTAVGATEAILASLEAHGLFWDDAVVFQHDRIPAYVEALARLRQEGLVYPCSCSRRELREMSPVSGVYPGYCRVRPRRQRARYAWRLKARPGRIGFHDQRLGPYAQELESEVGDFVVKRADGLFAYQLAVVVDDAWQGITEVVRGEDLLDNTPRQIYLQELLGLPRPRYRHLPLVTDAMGRKLSKQTHAPALDDDRAAENIVAALDRLGLMPPAALRAASVTELLDWAVQQWRDRFAVGPNRAPGCADSLHSRP